MSDSVTSMKNGASSTLRSGTTNQVLLERLSVVENVLTGTLPTSSKSEKDVKITTWETRLLAEGGYNYVWLITYVALTHVRT